jgi:hypothetical protein
MKYGKTWTKGNKQFRYAYVKIGENTYKAKMVRDFARGAKKGAVLGAKWSFAGWVVVTAGPAAVAGGSRILAGGTLLAILKILNRLKHG